MELYNSLSRKKEVFKENVPGKVSMYTCGPTVYHFAHIGNLRSYIMEDVLEKHFRYSGYDVKRVMNITDVGHLSSDADTGEDKMVKGAKRENKTVMDIAKFYTDAFFEDCKKLNIKTPDVVEPATNCIDEFITMVQGLLDKGYAYVAGGNVYFDTSKLKNYYCLTNQDSNLVVGARESVLADDNKKNQENEEESETKPIKKPIMYEITKNKASHFNISRLNIRSKIPGASILDVRQRNIINIFVKANIITPFFLKSYQFNKLLLISLISCCSFSISVLLYT